MVLCVSVFEGCIYTFIWVWEFVILKSILSIIKLTEIRSDPSSRVQTYSRSTH